MFNKNRGKVELGATGVFRKNDQLFGMVWATHVVEGYRHTRKDGIRVRVYTSPEGRGRMILESLEGRHTLPAHVLEFEVDDV